MKDEDKEEKERDKIDLLIEEFLVNWFPTITLFLVLLWLTVFEKWLVIAVIAIFFATAAFLAHFVPQLKWLNKIFFVDVYRAKKRAAQRKANQFFIDKKLLPKRPKRYEAYAYRKDAYTALEGNLNDLDGITAKTLDNFVKENREYFNAQVVATKINQDGKFLVKFFHQDPLEPWLVDDQKTDYEKYSVVAAKDENGDEVSIFFENVPVVLVGGSSGSGKTASLKSFLYPYLVKGIPKGKTELFGLIDGKSGYDWMDFSTFSEDGVLRQEPTETYTDFLEKCLVTLTDFENEMNRRLYLGSNLWDEPDISHQLLIIDEFQVLFEKLPRDLKKENELIDKLRSTALSISRRCRAAKQTFILITQRPSAESLPTALRDQAAIRIGFRVGNSDSSKMIFGYLNDQDFYPHQIPPQNSSGIAVIAGEDGRTKRIRFGYNISLNGSSARSEAAEALEQDKN